MFNYSSLQLKIFTVFVYILLDSPAEILVIPLKYSSKRSVKLATEIVEQNIFRNILHLDISEKKS